MVYPLTGMLPTAHRLQPLRASEQGWSQHEATVVPGQLPSLSLASMWAAALCHGCHVTFGTVPQNNVECHGCLHMRQLKLWVELVLVLGL